MCVGHQRYIDDREREIEIPQEYVQIYIKIYARINACMVGHACTLKLYIYIL